MRIPKIIHQLWKSDVVPRRWDRAGTAVRHCHPDWEYRLWTDATMDHHVKTYHRDLYPLFVDFNRHIMRVDVFRYVLMHDFGGMYCDLDYEFLRPFHYGDHEVVLSLEYDRTFGDNADQVANYVFASARGHDLWVDILADVQANPPHSKTAPEVCTVTGPGLLTRVFHANKSSYLGIELTAQPVLSPRRVHGNRERKIYLNSGITFGFHHGWGSWRERLSLEYLKRKLPRLLRRLVGVPKPDPSLIHCTQQHHSAEPADHQAGSRQSI